MGVDWKKAPATLPRPWPRKSREELDRDSSGLGNAGRMPAPWARATSVTEIEPSSRVGTMRQVRQRGEAGDGQRGQPGGDRRLVRDEQRVDVQGPHDDRAQEHDEDQRVALELRDPLEREGGHDGADADDGRGVVPVARVEDDVDGLDDLVRVLGRVVAEDVVELADHDQDGNAHHEAGHDRVRDVVDHLAELQQRRG